jgi:hypothetical protein
MALPRDIVEQLDSLGRKARTVASRESRLFLQLGEIAGSVHQLVTAHGEPKAFAAWCRRYQIVRADAYKAMAAWRLLGAIPGAEKQPRTVLELLGSSERAAEEAKALFARRLTIREARAILERHRAPESRLKTPAIAYHSATFDTPAGHVAVTYQGDPANLLGAMLAVVRQLQSAAVVKAPEIAPAKSIFGRLAG